MRALHWRVSVQLLAQPRAPDAAEDSSTAEEDLGEIDADDPNLDWPETAAPDSRIEEIQER